MEHMDMMSTMSAETAAFFRHRFATITSCVLLGSKPGTHALTHALPRILRENDARIFVLEETLMQLEHIAVDPTKDEALRERAMDALDMLGELVRQGLAVAWKLPETGEQSSGSRSFTRQLRSFILAHHGHAHLGVVTQNADLWRELVALNKELPTMDVVAVRRVALNGELTIFNAGSERMQSTPPRQLTPPPQPMTLTELPATPVEPELCIQESNVLMDDQGRPYILTSELLDSGNEASIYETEDPAILCKVFNPDALTERKQAKVRFLAALPPVDGAVLPSACLCKDGTLVGYAMPRINGVTLSALDCDRSLKRLAPHFAEDRLHFVRIAEKIVRTVAQLRMHNVAVGDLCPNNIMIGRDESGKLDAERVYLIDLDAAQISLDGLTTIPADGLTGAFTTPRLGAMGFDQDTLRTDDDLRFLTCLVACTTVQCLAHPFAAFRDDAVDLRDAIIRGEFPFGIFDPNTRHQAHFFSPEMELFSYMPPTLKKLFHTCFTAAAKREPGSSDFHTEGYPTFEQLIRQLNHYIEWMQDPGNATVFPELRSTHPTTRKPCVTSNRSAAPVRMEITQLPMTTMTADPAPVSMSDPIPEPVRKKGLLHRIFG